MNHVDIVMVSVMFGITWIMISLAYNKLSNQIFNSEKSHGRD